MNHISAQSFDQSIAREGMRPLKYDGRLAAFDINDVRAMRLAVLDFAVPKAITARENHTVIGCSIGPESLYEALIDWLLAMQNEGKRFAIRHTKMLNHTALKWLQSKSPLQSKWLLSKK